MSKKDDKTITWTARDLGLIKSRAVSICQNLASHDTLGDRPIISDSQSIEKFCMVSATLVYLRGQGLLSYIIKIEDINPKNCEHNNVEPFLDTVEDTQKYVCAECDAEVRSVGWVEVSDK